MIAGIMLSESEEEETHIAFLGDENSSYSIQNDEELVEKIEEKKPEIVAVDAGSSFSDEEFTDTEEGLKEEGYSFTPSSAESKKVKRLQSLKSLVNHKLSGQVEFIRFDPHITSEELAIDGDEAFESLGVDPSCLDSAQQFDAMLGAVTARFYQENQFEDLGIIVPEPVNE